MKIGSQLFTLRGPRLVEQLASRGDRVFLDLRFHDIPIPSPAVASATELGVWMVNVHASGGLRMMQAARDAARESAARSGRPAPLVIAVTVLTSMSDAMLAETGVAGSALDQVGRLARLTQEAGLDGVVASPRETTVIRRECGPDFVIVTPGIRGGSAATGASDDQERTMSARDAIDAGASYIVVGRPIIAAADPREAATRIAAEITRAGVHYSEGTRARAWPMGPPWPHARPPTGQSTHDPYGRK
jgi:orotidine-5'-phosphate decarboxylase